MASQRLIDALSKVLEYARQRRDNAYTLYTIYADHRSAHYSLANEQYYMGKYHEALDHYWYLEKITQQESAHVS